MQGCGAGCRSSREEFWGNLASDSAARVIFSMVCPFRFRSYLRPHVSMEDTTSARADSQIPLPRNMFGHGHWIYSVKSYGRMLAMIVYSDISPIKS